ncbi:unnamed protein product, partial [Trichobilharzia regenti]
IRKTCSTETTGSELDNLRSNLLNNGYPTRFIERNIKKESAPRQIPVPKKKLFMSFTFKGDTISELIKNRLSKCIKRTFPAANLELVLTSRNMIRQCVKDRLSLMSTSVCFCGAVYIGRCKRNLRKRVAEHYPVWLMKGERRTAKSSICDHLLESGHLAPRDSSFKVIYMQNRVDPKAYVFFTYA